MKMCFMFRRTTKIRAEARKRWPSIRPTEARRRPRSNPLYWKKDLSNYLTIFRRVTLNTELDTL